MSIIKRLFGKSKAEQSDGQDEFFKEDFAPVVNRSPASKQDEKFVEPLKGVNDPGKKPQPILREEPEEKEPMNVSRSAGSVVVKPVPKSERIIMPSSAKVRATEGKPDVKAKAAESKPAAKAKAAESKPTAKAKATESKPTTKAKAAESKPAAKIKDAPKHEFYDESPEHAGAVVQEGRATPNGKFDIQRSKNGKFFFTLYASNHSPIAHSQMYSSLSGATTGINSIIANSPKAGVEDKTLKKSASVPYPKWEIYADKAGQYRFRLYAPNGQCVCHSAHGYSTKSGCKGGMDSITRFSAEAKVDKSYLK